MQSIWYYVFPKSSAAELLPMPVERELEFLVEIYERLRGRELPVSADDAQPIAAGAPLGQYRGADAAIMALKARIARPQELWWTDLAQAELCINSIVDADAIAARLNSWRRRMKEVIGDRRYAAYMMGASPADAMREVALADLNQCIRAIYYFYGAYGVAAKSRSMVTASLLQYAAIILAVLGCAAALLTRDAHPALEWTLAAAAAGVVGSVANVQRRLEDPRIDVDPFYRYVTTTSDRLGIALVSPLLGAIFGAVIYAVLRSKLIEGSILPTFSPSGAPADGAAASMLLVFGFIAGFAEQLVPDALTRIAKRALGEETTFVHAAPAAESKGSGTSANAQRDAPATTIPRRTVQIDRRSIVIDEAP